MTDTLYDTYNSTVRRVASGVNYSDSRADIVGKTRADYEGELALVSVETQQSFRGKRGFRPDEERRYVNGALWMRGRHLRRELFRANAAHKEDAADTAAGLMSDIESHLEARDAVRVLRSRLGERFALLGRWVEAGGMRAAHIPALDGPFATFYWRLNAIRKEAREILEAG